MTKKKPAPAPDLAKPTDYTGITVPLYPELKERLKALAKNNRRSMGQESLIAIERYCAEVERQAKENE